MTTTVSRGKTPARQGISLTRATGLFSTLVIIVLAFWGGWTRRWISDDGLIVLRTVRNLLAGNGPVFNAGERVEANTSSLWQYLIWFLALFTDARLEIIAMWLGLLLTTAALAIAVWGSMVMYRSNKALVVVPIGGIIYLTLPPARDFATSGLEWGLSIFWLAVLWLLLAQWSQPRLKPVGRHARGASFDRALYFLAFWCGISWLVRPELALYGGLTGILLMVTAKNWKVMLGILAFALPVPAAYQIFRMGYYGLITPHTAVAKSASDSAWASGWEYVQNLTEPYALWLALAVALLIGAVVLLRATEPTRRPSFAEVGELPQGRFRGRSRPVVVVLVIVCALLHFIYVIRVGGDFMHGRMLLLPLFAILLPLSLVPVFDLTRTSRWHDLSLSVGALFIGGWAIFTVLGDYEHPIADSAGELGIVDERGFWTQATDREPGDPPLVAADFLDAPIMQDYTDTVAAADAENSGLMLQIATGSDPDTWSWIHIPRMTEDSDLQDIPPTVSMLNLGMTGMNAPLDIRVIDNVGLSNPLAARQPRIDDGRIGHDKWLSPAWQAADSATEISALPGWTKPEDAELAREALRHPDFVELFETYRSPMTVDRFFSNIRFSLTTGRTLEFSDEPEDYLTGMQDGQVSEASQIMWPISVNLDQQR
ncbi:flagellar motor control protein ZomB [Corynebacterium sp. A21]|uniref:flagellar motor control protein ZomB n=1 Tax=Corynebacterium sp. A21 TaxID=3457318 RepID=UPI003FD33AC3